MSQGGLWRYAHNVLVITPDFVYDFRISWHIDRFKRRCEEAWSYLEYHVYGRLHLAQDARGYAGFWTGGNLPFGYILDTREKVNGVKTPNFYRYVVYEPHARIVHWIFRRFKELHGCVSALMREIERKPYLSLTLTKVLTRASGERLASMPKSQGVHHHLHLCV